MRIKRLQDARVTIWLDTLSRDLLDTGELERLIRDFGVTGATSNPTIFAKAITTSARYDEQLHAAAGAGIQSPEELFFALALEDVGRAADLLLPGRAAAATASSPSSARPTSRTTRRGPSPRPSSSGAGSRGRT